MYYWVHVFVYLISSKALNYSICKCEYMSCEAIKYFINISSVSTSSVSTQLFLPKSVRPDVWSISTITHAECKHLALQSFWIVETEFVLSPTVDGVENGFSVLIFKFTAVSPICAKWWDWVHHFNFQIPEQCLNLWLKVGQETCSQKVVSVPTADKKSLAAKSGETKSHIFYKN